MLEDYLRTSDDSVRKSTRDRAIACQPGAYSVGRMQSLELYFKRVLRQLGEKDTFANDDQHTLEFDFKLAVRRPWVAAFERRANLSHSWSSLSGVGPILRFSSSARRYAASVSGTHNSRRMVPSITAARKSKCSSVLGGKTIALLSFNTK